MALPSVGSLIDCADLSKTVLPYVYQLYDLPQKLLQSYNKPAELHDIYLNTNPLVSGFAFSLFLAPLFLVISEITRNFSQVDRFWSILPTVYNFHFVLYAHLAGLPTQRLDNLLAVSVVWSLRLTFNYWRRGGYTLGSEDYRWEIIRKRLGPTLFFLLNVTFISFVQNILLFLITTPTYVMLLASRFSGKMATADIISSRVIMGLILVAFFADQQQWDFQNAKKAYQQTAKVPAGFHQEDLDRGFVVSGLWAWSRHPNFAAEQAVWALIYQWGCLASDTVYNWTLVGAVSYLLLFQGSTWFTELITARKYPNYEEYQQRVGKFIPRFNSNLPGDLSDEKSQLEIESKISKDAKVKKSRK